ncbi:MAG: DNA repair protein RecN [Anaerolineae bacterium]
MLRELHIQNFAIIDELHLHLEPGFNILTGETGAGKSILIDAVDLLLGSRADLSAIRAGESQARIEGMFVLSPEQQAARAELLAREGLEGERSDTLWLSRQLRDDGRSVARVNGNVVSVTLLGEVAEGLVDIHGQSEHLSLLRVQRQRDLLDRFADLMPLCAEVRAAVQRLQEVRRELRTLQEGERQRMQRLDLLRFQVDEITKADPRPGELEALEAERTRLVNAEQLTRLVSKIIMLLEEGVDETETPSVIDLLGEVERDVHALVRVDESLAPEAQALETIGYEIDDLVRRLRDYLEQIEFNPKRQRRVEDRLVLLRRLQRKYGSTLEEVVEHARQAAEEIKTLTESDERIARLAEREETLLGKVTALATQLSQRRQEAARALVAGVEAELDDLRMAEARFGVSFRWREDAEGIPLATPVPTERHVTADAELTVDETSVTRPAFDGTGMDRVEFLIAPNVGEGFKPITKIASGGETSRLMLALKTVLSRADETPTLIFDEIDQGIGGRIGAVVGAKLWRLTVNDGRRRQVLCVTHLPQLAGFGDAHFGVRKVLKDGRTITRVERLEGEARLQELAQMLGTPEDVGVQGSREILAQAERLKTPQR